ncbi:DUF6262 family protein [Thauera aminoaromatica]|jgi:hypothetical protein|uniref:Transposase n=1 Tax=Thauera aminoaromatica TaxID=164330 RepID=A0A5C7S160_THASP|nr:DUF6262 family protein [Thauera aminoaromatica]TXH77658.1 MAG: hypothetical protein E6Q80_24315 [Thauera aminoaromatica]
MSVRGSNGVQDGERNTQRFLTWLASVEDFKPYILQGVLSISRVARECGLNRDVFYTNPEIRDVHWPQLNKRLEHEGVLRSRVANPVEAPRRTTQRSAANEARIKQIQEENEAVKAENRELRKQLEKFKAIDEILHTTGRLPW